MNPNDILNTARQCSEATRGAIWYFQSRCAEDHGFDKVAEEMAEFFSIGVKGMVNKPFKSRIYASELSGYLQRFCTSTDSLPHSLVNIFCDFAAQASALAKQRFYLTNIGSTVWETLDWCREERRPCFIEGREGRGKTASARAWFEAHRGEARYVSLPGMRTQRDFFEAIAAAYGIGLRHLAPHQIRWRLKDMIIRSGLILILDEAHHALPERHKGGRPPLIDWIDCDLCNADVPVALVSTPQFGPQLSEFEDRTTWNAGQFRRRFSGRWTRLADKTDEKDLAALAQQALPGVGKKGIQLAVGYAGTFGRDVSGLFDLVRDAERRARKAGEPIVTYQHLREAFELDRVPSENAMASAFKRQAYAPEPNESENLPEGSEPIAAPLQRGRTSETELTAPDRGVSARLPVLH